MRSIKPGRGPSAMGAMGSAASGLFGIVWTIAAINMGAPIYFALFGVIFVVLAIAQGIYHYKNATGKNRMSLVDITDNNSEPDPLDNFIHNSKSFENQTHEEQYNNVDNLNYCPFCGNKIIDAAYNYCTNCGEDIRK